MAELICGVDLGGTKIAVALVDAAGRIHRKEVIRGHRGKKEDAIVAAIADAVRRLCEHEGAVESGSPPGGNRPGGFHPTELLGIGVGTSGHVDCRRGVVVTNSNLPGFTDYPLQRKLQEHFDLPVVIDNDANAQAYAEFCFGAGRGAPNMVFVTVSTGIGAGIIIDSRLYRGVNGTAGEIGHTIVNPHSTIRCGCGNYGCLMAHGSGLALPQVVREKLAHGGCAGSIDLKSLQDHELTGEVIKRGLDAGDPLCTEIVTEYADYLAIGLHNLFQSFNPGLIVLGGGLTEWGPVYLDRVSDRFYELAREMMYERVEIRLSELGADAAVLGAAALMLEPV